MKHLFISFLFLCLLPWHYTATAQNAANDVLVYDENTPVPASCIYKDDVAVRDGGFKINCGYEQVLMEAINKVVKKGGNVLKINKLKRPSTFGSSCYQIIGEAYYTDSLAEIKQQIKNAPDTITGKLISDTAQYALLYIYRPANFTGGALSFWVHVDDREVCRVSNNSKCIVKIDKEGEVKLWSTIETRSEKKLNIEFGKVYFLRCEIGMGVWVGRPKLTLQQTKIGYKEFKHVRD